MGSPLTPQASAASLNVAAGKARRRSPSATEQARREAWGREWGAVGAEYARKRRARKG